MFANQRSYENEIDVSLARYRRAQGICVCILAWTKRVFWYKTLWVRSQTCLQQPFKDNPKGYKVHTTNIENYNMPGHAWPFDPSGAATNAQNMRPVGLIYTVIGLNGALQDDRYSRLVACLWGTWSPEPQNCH
jgi:hypothetical protein